MSPIHECVCVCVCVCVYNHVHVREVILKDHKRRPIIDIDGPVDLDGVIRDILSEFGGKSILQFRTTCDYHIIVADVM